MFITLSSIPFRRRTVQIVLAGLLLGSVALPAASSQESDEAPAWVDGEVRRIDTDARKLTLRHGDIRNLDMPGMTMVFRVKGSVALDAIKVGDKVRFTAVSEQGQIVLTRLEPAN